jgi:hypothetical protein
MATIRARAERVIGAPADRVYGILADFRTEHPKILPPAFSDLRVEAGGRGAGTVITFTVKIGGRRRSVRARVDEPEPGRVLTETALDSGAVTTFTVSPERSNCRVRIETAWEPKGLLGWIEGLLAPRMLRRLYEQELELLEKCATAP